MFQTSNVVMAEPPATSVPKKTPSSHTVSLQVEDFCVTCWDNNVNHVSDPRRHAGPETLSGRAEGAAASLHDPNQRS